MSELCALVLAAGLGSRFGGRKLLSPWRGGVLLDGALGAALAAPVRAVVLVTGADGQAVAAAGRDLAERRRAAERLRVVWAERYAEGLSVSLRAGLAALPAACPGVLVFLGDMPLAPAEIAPRLAAALQAGAPAAAPLCQGRRGHPVAISRALFPQLEALAGDQGAKIVLEALSEQLALIETDDIGVLIDVDLPGQAPP